MVSISQMLMTSGTPSFDPAQFGAEWIDTFKTIESTVGGRIITATRQARWRPAFFLDVEVEGRIEPVCFRGARREHPNADIIRYEYECFRILEEAGIPVPHIYGFCEEYPGIVMAKAPGRANLATAVDDIERESVRKHFIEILARIHALPLDAFDSLGRKPLTTARELGLGDSLFAIEMFRAMQKRPEPGLEFLIRWSERNYPRDRDECCFITCDSGQFVFENGAVTGLLDLELAYLGDPMADLGGLFARDLSEPLGGMAGLLDLYESSAGRSVDRDAVLYHAVRWSMSTPLLIAGSVADPPKSLELVQYLAWYLVYQRAPLELVAHIDGVALAEPSLPAEESTPFGVAHDGMVARLEPTGEQGSFRDFETDGLRRIAIYVRESDRRGHAMLEEDLAEASDLLGRRVDDWRARDEALVDAIRNERCAEDRMLAYLFRRYRREELLLQPAMRDLIDVRLQTL